MRVAVVGGGINGVMSAWALANLGCEVTVFERGELMGATSSASTKLLHGGIRYLEQGHFGLVREALRERTWWIQQAPHLARPIEILMPVYTSSRRGKWIMRLGLAVYDWLCGQRRLGTTRWLDPTQMQSRVPGIRRDGLLGAYAFFDGQMDDRALGCWAAEQAKAKGAECREHHPVNSITAHGELTTAGGKTHRYDRIVNAAGPWAGKLLRDSGIASRYELDLVRGSHLLLDRPLRQGILLEAPGSPRIFFVLPYQGRTLIGTTEARQTLDDSIRCSGEEQNALIELHNTYLEPAITAEDIQTTFAGLRPLLRSHANPTRATREYVLERTDRLVTIFGGKWTTSRALGEKAAALTLH
ncbi:MAG: glycerol-3-phosphate dehydrogenase/oxidase [Betaproteobacteria bacterium]|nr:glycerol-3-phosphate dehydrogenase/oxidase [Betaproteobacteria bacterium]